MFSNNPEEIESTSFDIYLKKSERLIHVDKEQTPLDALIAAGVDTSYSCAMGACGECSIKVLEGEPEHLDAILSDYERNELNLFCPCVSRSKSKKLTLDM